MRKVGVLGGMGPEATILLMQRVLAATDARDDADHVPLMVDNNTQVPSRIAALIDGTGEDPAPVLAGMAKSLEAAGCEALAMPCNTAHAYAAAISASVRIPLLNMVDLGTAALAGSGRRVGMLASPAVRRAGVFDAAFDRAGLHAVWLPDDGPLLPLIKHIKAHGAAGAGDRLLHAADSLPGADVYLIGCSEFSLVTDQLPARLSFVDTMDELARAVVDFATATGN